MIGNIEATLILIMMDFDQIEMCSNRASSAGMFEISTFTALLRSRCSVFESSTIPLQAERFERSEHGEAKRFEVEVREDRTKMKTPARVNVTP